MAILNNYTKIPPERTVGEITRLLVAKGAKSVTTHFDEAGLYESLRFSLLVGGVLTNFRLPVNRMGVAKVLSRGAAPTKVQMDRASWIAWRIMKDWVEAQIALIESAQAEVAQVFMHCALDSAGSQTMYEHFVNDNQRKLASGGR